MALAELVEQKIGRAYTLLPPGVSELELYKFDDPIIPLEYPIDRSEAFLRATEHYAVVDVFASHMRDLALLHSKGLLWAEDYLARPDDPILSDRAIGTAMMGDAVTHLVSGKALVSSRGVQLIRKIRSMSMWTGSFLRQVDISIAHQVVVTETLRESLLSRALIVFAMEYRMDGFIFFELAE